MGLETADFIEQLVTTNPIGNVDPVSQGDDHLRLIKSVLKNTLPGAIGPLTFNLDEDGAADGPRLVLRRTSASPAVNDALGGFLIQGKDSANNNVNYSHIYTAITDPAEGVVSGELKFRVAVNGPLVEIFRINETGLEVLQGNFQGDGSGLTFQTLTVAGNAVIGNDANTQGAALELGTGRTGNGPAFVDFHSQPGTDFDARIIRNGGANGNLEFILLGVGEFVFTGAPISGNGAGLEDLNASQLTSGTIPDGRLAGTYGGFSINAPVQTITIGNLTSQGFIRGNSNIEVHQVGTANAHYWIKRSNGNNWGLWYGDANDGSTRIRTYSGDGSTVRAQLVLNGANNNASFNGDVTFNSDIRWKKDIDTIEGALEKVRKFRAVTYTRRDDGTRSFGLIAQEAEEVFPLCVEEDASGYKRVNYPKLCVLAFAAIDELAAKLGVA